MSLRRALGFILFLFTTVSCHSQQPAPLRSNNEAWNRADLGIQALQQWYVPETGLYRGTGWWNAANVLTALTDYMRISGSRRFVTVLATTYTQAQITVPEEQRVGPLEKMTGFPGFLNKYYDDEGWWALAWIDAYDLTRDERYLASAQSIFDDMAEAWDSTCGGGIWWSRDRTYKNAIANELFFSVAAHLATRVSASRQRYTDWATREWKWFGASGMVNKRHLVNDGLLIDKVAGTCRNNGARCGPTTRAFSWEPSQNSRRLTRTLECFAMPA